MITKQFEITYSPDESMTIQLVYSCGTKLKMTSLGKTWPKHTQCLMYMNGLLQSFGTVVKHANDIDDPKFAYKLVTTKALTLNNKWLRKTIWGLVHTKLKEL